MNKKKQKEHKEGLLEWAGPCKIKNCHRRNKEGKHWDVAQKVHPFSS